MTEQLRVFICWRFSKKNLLAEGISTIKFVSPNTVIDALISAKILLLRMLSVEADLLSILNHIDFSSQYC